MKIISLGFNCYIKALINETIYSKQSDIFDWMNTFYFKNIIMILKNNFNIGEHIIKSQLDIDKNKQGILYNSFYDFRLPHETNDDFYIKYEKRYTRFINYKNIENKYLFIRNVNIDGEYGLEPENIKDNYSEEKYNELMIHLPENSKIILIVNKQINEETIKLFSNKFYLLEDSIQPEYCFYGDKLKYKYKIINLYSELFKYIDENFYNLNLFEMNKYIKNSNIENVTDK